MIDHQEITEQGINKMGRAHEFLSWRPYHPKPFVITDISLMGKEVLGVEVGETLSFPERLYPQKAFPGRVVFDPQPMIIEGTPRYKEVKGYGIQGFDFSLSLHDSGDVLFGMFHQKALKEYQILEQGRLANLLVPLPLAVGRFSKDEMMRSALRYYSQAPGKKIKLDELTKRWDSDPDTFEDYLKEKLYPYPLARDPLAALKQPDSLGVVLRAPLSPIRAAVVDRDAGSIAKIVGHTFTELLRMGYLHLCPSIGNWTVAGELTDMSDCFDLQKDQGLDKVIQEREAEIQANFWQDLIGRRHTGRFSEAFRMGMFGEEISLVEAAKELERISSSLP